MAIYANGQYLVSPQANVTIVSQSQGSGTANTGRTLWLLGSAEDGEPQTVITLNSPGDAYSILKDGDLVQAAILAFGGSPAAAAPSSVSVLRVDEATQSTSDIKSSGAVNQIVLTSTSYGSISTQYKWQINTASGSIGYKVQLGSDYTGPGTLPATTSQDNIYLPVFSVYYSGTGTSPTVTITDTEVTLTAQTSDTGGSVTLIAGMTVQTLVNQLNQFPGWVSTVLDPNSADLVLPTDVVPGTSTPSLPALLDNVSATAVGTTSNAATTLYANIAAVVRYINSGSQPWMTAVRQASVTALATSSSWTYLAGGTTTAPTSTDWGNGFTALENVNGIGVVVPLSNTSTSSAATAIWAQAETHCTYMKGIGQPRLAVVGDISGQTIASEITNAAAVNSDRVIVRWPEFVATNIYGNQATLAPYMEAARTGAILVANPVQEALTLLPLPIVKLGATVNATTVNQAIQGGICITKPFSSGGFVIAAGVTTWTGSTAFDKVNISTKACEDVVSYDLRQALESGLIGYASNLSPQAAQLAYGIVERRLNFWASQGVLVGDKASPPFSNIQVSVTSQAVLVTADIHPAAPTNFAVLTLSASPWTSV